MSIRQMKKDLQELKKFSSIMQRNAVDEWLKNATDEELQAELDSDLEKLGFESEEEFHDAAKKFILEKDEHADVSCDSTTHIHIFELFEDIGMFEEFMMKYSSLELME